MGKGGAGPKVRSIVYIEEEMVLRDPLVGEEEITLVEAVEDAKGVHLGL